MFSLNMLTYNVKHVEKRVLNSLWLFINIFDFSANRKMFIDLELPRCENINISLFEVDTLPHYNEY